MALFTTINKYYGIKSELVTAFGTMSHSSMLGKTNNSS